MKGVSTIIRALFAAAGVFGVALMVYEAIEYPWWSSLFAQSTLDYTRTLFHHVGILYVLLMLVLHRLWVPPFLLGMFCQAVRWRYYLGSAEVLPLWTDDLNPDAN
jgi:hypothetical protein